MNDALRVSGLLLVGVLACACSDGTKTTDGAGAQPSAQGGGGLYDRLGKNSGIKAFVDTLVTEELKDPEIAAFFAGAGKDGHPSAVQIKECLVLQIGQATGGPEQYPAAVSGGFMCRDMKSAHAKLGISAATFDKFVGIAGKTAKAAGVGDEDIATIAGFLNGTKTDVTGGAA